MRDKFDTRAIVGASLSPMRKSRNRKPSFLSSKSPPLCSSFHSESIPAPEVHRENLISSYSSFVFVPYPPPPPPLLPHPDRDRYLSAVRRLVCLPSGDRFQIYANGNVFICTPTGRKENASETGTVRFPPPPPPRRKIRRRYLTQRRTFLECIFMNS